MDEGKLFTGGEPHDGIDQLPPAPPWRDFAHSGEERARTFQASPDVIRAVNVALVLRRPLLLTGDPGCGKSSLPEAVARELKLGRVLRWAITSRSTLEDGLYRYDALARLQEASLAQSGRGDPARPHEDIGRYLRLGPLGTALYAPPGPSPAGVPSRPRVLLIDEIDKSDIDLPNDLLHVFEEGTYEIRELVRLADPTREVMVLPDDGKEPADQVPIRGGRVRCRAFPFVVLTSNGERELPPAFLRRCIRLHIPRPGESELRQILKAHLKESDQARVDEVVKAFLFQRDNEEKVLATDQLLNAAFLVTRGRLPGEEERQSLLKVVLQELGRL